MQGTHNRAIYGHKYRNLQGRRLLHTHTIEPCMYACMHAYCVWHFHDLIHAIN